MNNMNMNNCKLLFSYTVLGQTHCHVEPAKYLAKKPYYYYNFDLDNPIFTPT